MLSRVSLLAVMFFATFAHAELPPGSYDKLRAEATDAVIIQVTSVKAATNDKIKSYTVEAKVLGVERSKSGLKKNDTITISFSVSTIPIPGPSPVPELEKDGVYPAFLKKQGKTFEPAAYGSSFKMTPEG